MTTDGEKLETFERGGAIEVPVARIEAELAGLWRQAAQSAGKKHPVTRACLWNLIVRVDSEPMFVAAKPLIDEISKQIPARVILLHTAAADGGDTLRAWVEANWRKSGHGDSGSDEVTLYASGRAVERLPSLVRSLAVTDAPTAMLWWGAPPQPTTRHLLHEIDRLIVDTRQLPREADLAEYQRISDELPALEVVDCAWLGVRPLRGLCAALFDPPRDPGKLEVLDRVRVISGVSGCQSRALLAFGWLASRLGWRDVRRLADEPSLRRFRATRRAGGQVTLELETRLGKSSHGVAGLELEAAGDRWTLRREEACIEVRGPNIPERVQPVRQHSDAELVATALGPRGRDPIFKDSLREAARLVEATQ